MSFACERINDVGRAEEEVEMAMMKSLVVVSPVSDITELFMAFWIYDAGAW